MAPLLMTSGSEVGGVVATLRMQEVPGAGRSKVKASQGRGKPDRGHRRGPEHDRPQF